MMRIALRFKVICILAALLMAACGGDTDSGKKNNDASIEDDAGDTSGTA